MKLGTQVTAGLALLLVLTTSLAVWQLVLIRRLHEANRHMASADLEVSRASLRMRLEIDRLTSLTQRFFVLRDPAYRGELERVRGQVEEDLEQLGRLPSQPPELLPLLRDWGAYLGRVEAIEPTVPAADEPDDARETLLAALTRVRRGVAALDFGAVERVAHRIDEGRAQASEARHTAVLTVSAGLLLALVIAVWITRFTVRPLRSLARGAQAIAAGDFDYRVPVEGPEEVESLAHNFNQMAQRLGEVDRMKRHFVSSVSHDLKAPLASMQETTHLLLEDERLNDEQKRLLELNDRCAERLQRMIADLLDVAQLEAGAVEFDLQPVDLVRACQEVLAEASGLLEAGEIRVELDAPDAPLRVLADPQLLTKALWNLISNAVKFSPEGGTVRLAAWLAREEDGEIPLALRRAGEGNLPPAVVLTIADQGPGIADDDKPRIFERFYRSRKHERYASGTGLGLAITRAIIEQHDGRIAVDDAPGGGSLFTVLLPTIPEEGRPA